MMLILDSLPSKTEISHQNTSSSPPKHSLVYTQYTIPYRKKNTMWVIASLYSISIWPFDFIELCCPLLSKQDVKKNMLLVDYNMRQNTERHKTESQENLSLQGGE